MKKKRSSTLNKEDIIKKDNPLKEGDEVFATVSRLTTDGIGLYTDDYQYIYVHKSMTRKKYRLGEKVSVSIININKNNEANGSFIKQKEFARLDDSKIILNHLENLGGVLPLGNSSTPEEIKKYFSMSKSAFKRAVGALYKQQLITIDDKKITLIKK